MAGLILRFVAPSPLWLDEALSVHIAQAPMGLTDALRQDGHPGLYYLLLGWWIDLFGESEAAIRSLSGLCGVLTVGVLSGASLRYGRATAGTVLLLAATSPFLIAYSVEARMYSLVSLLVAAGWWTLQRAWDKPTWARLAPVAVLSALAVHTHYWLAFMVAGASLTLIFAARRAGTIRRAVRPVAALVAGGATLLAWLPVLGHQLAHTGTPWANRARPAEILVEVIQALGGTTRFEGEALGLMVTLLVLIGAFAVSPLGAQPLMLRGHLDSPFIGPTITVIFGFGLAAAVTFVTGSGFEPRYAAIIAPLLLLLAARGSRMLGPLIGPLLLAVVMILGLAVSVDNLRRDRSQGQDAAHTIDATVTDGDIVLFCPDQVGPATVRYLRTTAERRAFPSGDGYLVNWTDYLATAAATDPEALAAAASNAAKDRSVWLVLGSGYRNIDPSCARLRDGLARQRPTEVRLTAREVFEPMTVLRFPAS